jgi:hypothetical protein
MNEKCEERNTVTNVKNKEESRNHPTKQYKNPDIVARYFDSYCGSPFPVMPRGKQDKLVAVKKGNLRNAQSFKARLYQ